MGGPSALAGTAGDRGIARRAAEGAAEDGGAEVDPEACGERTRRPGRRDEIVVEGSRKS
jgi:hypothetical protein